MFFQHVRRIIGVAALTVIGLATAAVLPASAQAATVHESTVLSTVVQPAAAPAGCGSGNLCFWVNINFSDGPGHLAGNNSSWFVFSHSTCPNGTWADCASSIYNNGNSCTAHVWYLTGFGAPKLDIARGTGFSNLANVTTGHPPNTGNWNDNIESNSWC